MLNSEYYAIMNILGTLNFKQSPQDYTKFSLLCTGEIQASLDDGSNQKIEIHPSIYITLRDDGINVSYNTYDALDNGGLTLISSKCQIPPTVDKLLSVIFQILNKIYNSAEYEFIQSNPRYGFSERTLFNINMNSIKERMA